MKKKLLVFITLILSVVCLFTFTGCDEVLSSSVSTKEYLTQYFDAMEAHLEHFDADESIGDITLKTKESAVMTLPVELTVLDANDNPVTKEYTNKQTVDVDGVIKVKTINNVIHLYAKYTSKRVEKIYEVEDNKVEEKITTVNETEIYYYGQNGDEYVATFEHTTDEEGRENTKLYTTFSTIDEYNNDLSDQLIAMDECTLKYNVIIMQKYSVDGDSQIPIDASFSKVKDVYTAKFTTTMIMTTGDIIPSIVSGEITIKNDKNGLISNRTNAEIISGFLNIKIDSTINCEYKSSLEPLENPIEGATLGNIPNAINTLMMEL